MKKSFFVKGFALIALITMPIIASAQLGPSAATVTQDLSLKVDGSALLAIYNMTGSASGTGISMSLTGATEAGAAILDQTTNDSTRLRISSLVESGKTRTITAQIAPSLTGTGTELWILLTKPGNFQPAVANGGTAAAEQELTDGTIKTVVSAITTCWSGTAASDGYAIRYRYAKTTGATALVSRNITITYTITAEV